MRKIDPKEMISEIDLDEVYSYHVILRGKKNGKDTQQRVVLGFNAYELLGMYEFLRDDIIKQMRGEFAPEGVERKFVETNNE